MRQCSTAGVKIFVFGLIMGLVISTLLVALVGVGFLRRGVTIPIDREYLIDELTTQASNAMQTAIPGLLAQARLQLPQTVNQQVRSGLGEMSLGIANYEVKLPAAVVSRIDSYLQSNVIIAFGTLLDGLGTAAAQAVTKDQLLTQAAAWADSLQGRRFEVEVLWGIKVPMIVMLR